MEERSNLPKPKLAVEGKKSIPTLFNTIIEYHFIPGAYLSRKAVNEGTELAFDLEERENIDFGK
jgi:hypothetical protein